MFFSTNGLLALLLVLKKQLFTHFLAFIIQTVSFSNFFVFAMKRIKNYFTRAKIFPFLVLAASIFCLFIRVSKITWNLSIMA